MANTKSDTEKNIAANSPLPALSNSDVEGARKEGAKEDIKESAKETHRYMTDAGLPGEPPQNRWLGSDETTPVAPLLELSPEELSRRIDPKADYALGEEKVAALLKLERAGQNRTEYVQLLMKRLGVKSVYEVTDAGPPYTNDTTNITKL